MTDEFEQFWQAWKPRYVESSGRYVKLNKATAETEFRKACRIDAAAHITEMAQLFCEAIDERYIPDAFRWLRAKRWKDEISAPVSNLPAHERDYDTWTEKDKAEFAGMIERLGMEVAKRSRYMPSHFRRMREDGHLQPRAVQQVTESLS